jgi:hypothetical protein
MNTERWYKFLDIASVDAFLEELQDRSPEKGGPLVVKLPRAPGAREQRWAHLLCGPVDTSALAISAAPGASGATEDEVIALTRRVAQLENTVRCCKTSCKTCTSNSVCRSPDRTETNGRAKLQRVPRKPPTWRAGHPHQETHMDLAFTPDEQAFREEIRAWVKATCPPTSPTRSTTPCA